MKTAQKFCLVLVTTGTAENAKSLSRLLVEKKLAACVNCVPKISSVYSWKNKIVEDTEFLLVIKTRKTHLKKIQKIVLANHPYETPEILTVPLISGDSTYLNWLAESTTR